MKGANAIVGVMAQRLTSSKVSYPVALSLLLHGILAIAVVFTPQWFRGRPFKIPVTYEVTLIAPSGGGSEPKAKLAVQPGQKVATAAAKTPAPPPTADQPRDLLTLPSPPRTVIPQAALRPLPPVSQPQALALPAKRSAPDRRPPEVAAAPSRGTAMVTPSPPPLVAPPVAPIVAPVVAPPPSLALAKPARVRPSSAVPAPSTVAPRPVVAPKVAPPPPIAQPVITPPVITPPKVASRASQIAQSDLQSTKAGAAPSEAQSDVSAAQGLGIGNQPGVFVGNTDPALAYYFVLVQDKITSNWTPPRMTAGTMGSVNVSLRVLRSGQVRDLGIDTSSGDRAIDDSALRAVRLSSPMPPLPPLFKAETLSLELRFTLVGEKS